MKKIITAIVVAGFNSFTFADEYDKVKQACRN